jgi:hypothetical protein
MKVRIVFAALALTALVQMTGCCCLRECWCRRMCCSPRMENACCKPAVDDFGPIQPIPAPGLAR